MIDALDFSLIRGGPFYRFLRKFKLVRGERRDIVRQSLAFLAISWLPFVLLGVIGFVLRGEETKLLLNISVHARFLVAMPLLLAADEALHRLCGRAVTFFVEGRFAREGDSDPTLPLVGRAMQWASSPAVEAALALACFGAQIGVFAVTKKAGFLPAAAVEAGLSPAHVWYAFIALPLVNFLLLRLAYRWLIWTWLLFRFSRYELHLVATHPDHAGGLSPLADPTLGFSLLLAALGSVLASVWADRILQEGLRFTAFSDEFSIIVILGEIWAFAPLAAFSGGMVQSRLRGLLDYGQLGLRYTRAFQRRWVETHDDDGLLGTSDIQSLADLANSFEVVEKMRPVPFSPRHVIVVFAAMVAPMLPLVTTEVPMHDLLKGVGSTLLGGLPP